MAKYKHHADVIDDYDLERIISKSKELKQVVAWLERLKELDDTVDKAAVNRAIANLVAKIKKLDRKANKAFEEMTEFADCLAMACKGDN